MFCKNCGRQLDEGENLCPACGTVNATETPAATTGIEYAMNDAASINDRLKDEMAGQVFKWGLMSLIFSGTVCLSLLGFIFSFVAKSKANSYKNVFGEISGRANAGRILGKIGFGVGLGMTIYFALCVMLGIIIGLSDAGVMALEMGL